MEQAIIGDLREPTCRALKVEVTGPGNSINSFILFKLETEKSGSLESVGAIEEPLSAAGQSSAAVSHSKQPIIHS